MNQRYWLRLRQYQYHQHRIIPYWKLSHATSINKLNSNRVCGNVAVITPFKVIQGYRVCYNRKLICDFLLVINTNSPPILHRFRRFVYTSAWICLEQLSSCLRCRNAWNLSSYEAGCWLLIEVCIVVVYLYQQRQTKHVMTTKWVLQSQATRNCYWEFYCLNKKGI